MEKFDECDVNPSLISQLYPVKPNYSGQGRPPQSRGHMVKVKMNNGDEVIRTFESEGEAVALYNRLFRNVR